MWVWFPTELVKITKISSGASGGVFTKVCTRDNFPLYSMLMLVFPARIARLPPGITIGVDRGNLVGVVSLQMKVS